MDNNKNYKIAKGNNFANENSAFIDTENTDDFYYSGTLDSIFYTDKDLYIAALRNTDYMKFLKNNPVYQKWWNELDEKNLDPTANEVFQKQIECLDSSYIEYANSLLQQTKDKYTPFFNTLEQLYSNSLNGKPKPLDIQGDTATAKNRTLLLHNIPCNSYEDLQSRKDLGVIASEWFGKLEQCSEGRFCSFFIKKQGLNEKEPEQETPQQLNTQPSKMLTLIIDAEAPELQEFMRLDYFQYLRNEQAGILDNYTPDELNILQQLDQWTNHDKTDDAVLSRLNGSSSSSIKAATDNPDWVAIPAGVAPNYIIGVMAHNFNKTKEDMEYLKNVSKIFGVPVIDEQSKVLQGTKEKEQEEQRQM